MRSSCSRRILCLFTCLIGLGLNTSHASALLWQDLQNRSLLAAQTNDNHTRLEQRLLKLDEPQLSWLVAAEAEPELELPLPKGGFARVRLIPEAVLAADIAWQYPDIHTWRMEGLDGKVKSGRAELSKAGLRAMLVMANGDTLFIEPTETTQQLSDRHYRSLSKRANALSFQRNFSCGTEQLPENQLRFAEPYTRSTRLASRGLASRAGETLHTYRLAITASSGYTQYYKNDKNLALSAIVTTINRVNEIYQRDLSIRLQLVSGTNTIFTTADNPYDNNASLPILLDKNQQVLDKIIGNAHYDIGHLFTTDSGGIALVESVCRNSFKAWGISGWNKPEHDIFAIDFVAHEMGHQFGAGHTFNSTLGTCNGSRIAASAVEPGSGSTIMAYAGLCDSDYLQLYSDAMFHAKSIEQISNFAHLGEGASCATPSAISNRNPSVNAGRNYTIPARTPFILQGSANDADKDTLSYSWEQMDVGRASRVNVDSGDNALIRANMPIPTAQRTIPPLSDLINKLQTFGETLPATNRNLNFRLTVRDGNGGVGFDDMQVQIINTGNAFTISSPKTQSLNAGKSVQVNWEVAKTNIAPIDCQRVDIAFSPNGMEGSFVDLLLNAPNNGAANITLPATLGNKNRIRVKCSDNIFFALSDSLAANTTIMDPVPPDDNQRPSPDSDQNDYSPSGGGGSLPINLLLGLLGLAYWRHRPSR